MTSRSEIITTFVHRVTDTSKHSAAYKIFYYEWDVLVPHMFVYSDNYVRVAGIVSSRPDYDARLPNQMIGGRYTIVQMAKLMDEGATIQLQNPEDAKAIYDMVSEHLEDWSAHLINGSAFESSKVPLQDLMTLSQMADVLYGFAARYFRNEPARGKLARRLSQIRGRSKVGSGRKYVDPNAPIPESERDQMPNHNQSSQNILQHGGGRNSWS
jgi:hypothetical protein